MKRAITLTDELVAGARARGGREVSIRDAAVPGLALRVRPGGNRTWIFRRTEDGKQRRHVLGQADAMTVEDARDAARAILLGHDAIRPDRRKPVSESFAEFAVRYRARVATTWKPSTLAKFGIGLRRHLLPAFGARPMNRIAPQEVARWFHDCSRETPGRANCVLTDLRSMFSRAREWGVIDADAPQPCALVRRNRSAPCWRLLSIDELRRLGEALDAHAVQSPDETTIIRLILLTGCRSGEILRLRWEEVGEDRLQLLDSKSGPREVPLPPAAQALLKARRRPLDGGWVFPRPRDLSRPRDQITAVWTEVKATASVRSTTRLHDLRHTYASRALMAGETLQMAGKLLGHRSSRSTERYAHLEGRFLAAAADRVCAKVAELLG